jgi:hypothetical protein
LVEAITESQEAGQSPTQLSIIIINHHHEFWQPQQQ